MSEKRMLRNLKKEIALDERREVAVQLEEERLDWEESWREMDELFRYDPDDPVPVYPLIGDDFDDGL